MLLDTAGGADFVEGPAPFGIEGGQLVQGANPTGAAASNRFARGNESHILTFVRVRKYPSIAEAADAVLDGINGTNVPRGKADVKIEVLGGVTRYLKAAVCIGWGARMLGDGLRVAQNFRIEGGNIDTS